MRTFQVTDYLYLAAAAYCAANGLWVARNLPAAFRNASDAKTRGYFVGSVMRVGVYVIGGIAVLLGVAWVRWVLILALSHLTWRDSRQAAVAFAEGRKSAELAAAWEYVRGRVQPRATDYVAGLLLTSPTSLLPALALLLFPPGV